MHREDFSHERPTWRQMFTTAEVKEVWRKWSGRKLNHSYIISVWQHEIVVAVCNVDKPALAVQLLQSTVFACTACILYYLKVILKQEFTCLLFLCCLCLCMHAPVCFTVCACTKHPHASECACQQAFLSVCATFPCIPPASLPFCVAWSFFFIYVYSFCSFASVWMW